MCEINNIDDLGLHIKRFDIEKKKLKEKHPKLYSKLADLLDEIETFMWSAQININYLNNNAKKPK